ncbi:NADP oxidoreductase [Chrysiogenes arsenatis]|uniref:NADH-quinone oxidoreductase subunit B family protein n=1 Tax=Chrysiogenes arsenatis TaxID=309797 RepID=UPI0004212889|nr:NADP oxidoreductase [Chrysiogenes arsenatis]
MSTNSPKLRLATIWFGGCSGCHMSFLDIHEKLIDLAEQVDVVYSPLADTKEFPHDVDITLAEGAITNVENLELLKQVRERTKTLVSFGDCAITGNVTSLRNFFPVTELLNAVYHAGPGKAPHGAEAVKELPALLPKVLPIHHITDVDVFLPGCPPDPERIWSAVSALLQGNPVELTPSQRTFG